MAKFKPEKADLLQIKKVLKARKYNSVFVLVSLVAFVLFYAATVATNSFNLGTFIEMNGLPYAISNLVLLAISSALLGLFLALSLYRFDRIRAVGEKNTAIGTGGFLTALFSAGCPTCGSLFLPLVGIASLATFPLQGLELKIASIALLGAVNVRAAKSLKTSAVCKAEATPSKPIILPGMDKAIYATVFAVAALLLFNQAQIADVSSSLDFKVAYLKGGNSLGGNGSIELSDVDVSQISSTAMAVASLFPVNQIKSEDEAIAMMIPSGTPEYSAALGGISFDDPVNSMEYLAKWYSTLKPEIKQNDPETWQRYLNLAAAPRGISCEFCCGVGAQGITADGELRCGCKHNPAVQALTLGLMKYTDYSDAAVLREVIRWKTIFFPKNMVSLAMDVAGKDPSQLQNLPGMVGGC